MAHNHHHHHHHHHAHRYEDVPCGSPSTSPADENSPLYPAMSQGDPATPRLPTSPGTSLDHTASFATSDISGREALETCPLEEPGCYVLVPTGLSPDEGNKPSDDPKFFREKKIMPARKGFRKPMEEAERQAIKLNRKQGVCLRCKLFKEKVC